VSLIHEKHNYIILKYSQGHGRRDAIGNRYNRVYINRPISFDKLSGHEKIPHENYVEKNGQ
jgi:hypothetical protein